MALRMGSEDKKKVAIASVLGLVVLFLVGTGHLLRSDDPAALKAGVTAREEEL